ncbi:MAG: type II secretion system protein [Planctomycetota bacterium]|nr:type II secretion system protein [Planctomycetota bacterium]
MARAFSLVELVVTMVIVAILMAAIGSTIVLASRAIPNANNPTACTIEASMALDQLVAELEAAVYISEHSQTAVAFTVADRNADGLTERIRYAWSGTPGDPLTRQYNGGTAAAFILNVQQFSLVPRIQSITEAYPGTGVEDTFDSLLVNKDSGAGFSDLNAKPDQWLGQHFATSLPGGTMGWRPTRVRFVVRKASSGTFSKVCLRPAGADLKPTSTVLQSQSMDAGTLPVGYAWTEFPFSGMDRVAPTNAQCLVVRYYSGTGNAATLQGCSGSGLVTSADSGATWSYSGSSALRAQLYGKVTQPGPTQYAVTQYLTAMRIVMKVTGVGRTAETIAQTLNQPVLYLGYWEADFSSNPTTLDANGDGAGDWVVHGGGTFPTSGLSGGVWQTTTAAIDTSPACDFAAATVVDLRMRSAAAGASAVFLINSDHVGTVCVPLTATLKLEAEGTQTLTVSRKKSDGTFESLITASGLPSAFVDLRLVIDTAAHSVSVTANGSFVGTYGYGAPAVSTTDKFASIYASGGTAEFDYARIRVLEPQP